MESRVILVTGIGGNVGQGIVRNIRRRFPHMRIIGSNTERLSAGNHLCDEVHEVPYAFDPTYAEVIRHICRHEGVELIIPSTDFEAYHLSSMRDTIPTVAASDAATGEVFLDKWLTACHFKSHGLPFAASMLPSDYTPGLLTDCIVKPRKGRGSREIFRNPENPAAFSDEYIVQEMLVGEELTTAFYVDRQNSLHGHITLKRELSSGATSRCCVEDRYDTIILPAVLGLMRSLPIRGACNLQGIVSPDGGYRVFEINGRISGTNSIRSNFGFEDVRYTVEEHLLGMSPTPPDIRKGVAVRILMDVIYPDASSYEEAFNAGTPHYIF